MDRFTVKAQEALQGAQRVAQQHSHQEITGEHLLVSLLDQPEGLIRPLLQKLGAPIEELSQAMEQELGRRAKVEGSTTSDTFLGTDLKQILDAAEAAAAKHHDDYTSTEHLLLGMLDKAGSSLKKILTQKG